MNDKIKLIFSIGAAVEWICERKLVDDDFQQGRVGMALLGRRNYIARASVQTIVSHIDKSHPLMKRSSMDQANIVEILRYVVYQTEKLKRVVWLSKQGKLAYDPFSILVKFNYMLISLGLQPLGGLGNEDLPRTQRIFNNLIKLGRPGLRGLAIQVRQANLGICIPGTKVSGLDILTK